MSAMSMGPPNGRLSEVYRLRAAGALDALSAPAIDLMTYLCHLADETPGPVFATRRELAATLDRHERRIGEAIRCLRAAGMVKTNTDGRRTRFALVGTLA